MYTIEQVQEILRDTYEVEEGYYLDGSPYVSIRPRIICADGFSFSMQASTSHYSIPRTELKDGKYDAIELGFPSEPDELIFEYAENCWWDDGTTKYTETVYPYVPIEIVAKLIDKHGGNPKLKEL